MRGGRAENSWTTARLIAGAAMLLALSACDKSEPTQATAMDAKAHCPTFTSPNFRWVAGGTLTQGADAILPEEARSGRIKIAGFWISAHEVTNGEFADFTRATGYVTMAERPPPSLPNMPPEMMLPGSAVFTVPVDGNPNWWRWVVGANWRKPKGPASTDTPDPREPVVHIAYEDALAFAKWRGMALPSEAQWEWAARSGGADPDAPPSKGANTYQGSFPFENKGSDGFQGSAPVACFPADSNGVHDMIGNVWEWTRDAQDDQRNIIKGGSFLCASNYCARYRPAARQFQERSLGTDHIGFRLIDTRRAPPAP